MFFNTVLTQLHSKAGRRFLQQLKSRFEACKMRMQGRTASLLTGTFETLVSRAMKHYTMLSINLLYFLNLSALTVYVRISLPS
jgi:hypothetical protein